MRMSAPGCKSLGLALIAALIFSLMPAAGFASEVLATASISGKVSVPPGTDATKIRVSAVAARVVSAYAGAGGIYTIDGLEAGTYSLSFSYAGSEASPVVAAPYAGGSIALGADAEVDGIDQVLQPAAIVSGAITAPAGSRPYQGSVDFMVGPNFHSSGGSVHLNEEDNGTFTVGGLAPGAYKVRYGGGAPPWATMWHGGVASAAESPAVTVVAGRNESAISDEAIVAAAISGSITGSNGQNQLVQAVASDGSVAESAMSKAGSYTLSQLFPGSYTLQFARASSVATTFEAQFYNNLPEGSGASAATPVYAGSGHTTGIDAALRVGATLTGRITGADGQPLEHVPVRVYTKDGSLVTRGASTGADGTFKASGLTTGSYLVAANMIATRRSGALGIIYSGNVRDESLASTVTTTVGQSTDIGTLSFATAMGSGVPYFTDVPAGSQFAGEMSWLAQKGISTGWTEGDGSKTYRPLQPVSRDAMAAFMYRLAGKPDFTPPAVSPFTDVPVGAQFYKEITWLASQGISAGWSEGNGTSTYRPLQPVNRDAMAAFMYRFAGNPPAAEAVFLHFTDVPRYSEFSKAINWLAIQGITSGWTEGNGSTTYRPLQPVNRDAMAAFMYRYNSRFGSQ